MEVPFQVGLGCFTHKVQHVSLLLGQAHFRRRDSFQKQSPWLTPHLSPQTRDGCMFQVAVLIGECLMPGFLFSEGVRFCGT